MDSQLHIKPNWADLSADDLLYEWTQTEEAGWSRELAPIEAHVVLGALYDARQELAEHPRRCDSKSPQGGHLCDREPGHKWQHVSWEGVEWRQ